MFGFDEWRTDLINVFQSALATYDTTGHSISDWRAFVGEGPAAARCQVCPGCGQASSMTSSRGRATAAIEAFQPRRAAWPLAATDGLSAGNVVVGLLSTG